ncbi:MAG: MerR family DNA-binding transcriptional regulator, partial [Pseudomonas aeruginosa]|nr:MerR family DNA-binding transcriptional regulator [Pseudomonas aeruginosa]
MLTIGQLARIFEISTKTLRHYDAIGLFVPARTDEERYLMRHIEDLARTAESRGIPRYSGFL